MEQKKNIMGARVGFLRKLLGLKPAVTKPKPPKPIPMSLDELQERIAEAERPSLWLQATDQPGFSKLGGIPDLEESFEWPLDPVDEPMTFIAQIDLAAARQAGGPDWLPDAGALYFFANADSIDMSQGARVIYRPGVTTGTPATLPKVRTFKERRVGMRAHPSYPSCDWLDLFDRIRHLDEDDLAPIQHLVPGKSQDWGDHRLGGYPSEGQGGALALEAELMSRDEHEALHALSKDPVAFHTLNEEAISTWRMLLQIDADDELGMTWLSSGTVWFFIREEDARAGDFSQVVGNIQFS